MINTNENGYDYESFNYTQEECGRILEIYTDPSTDSSLSTYNAISIAHAAWGLELISRGITNHAQELYAESIESGKWFYPVRFTYSYSPTRIAGIILASSLPEIFSQSVDQYEYQVNTKGYITKMEMLFSRPLPTPYEAKLFTPLWLTQNMIRNSEKLVKDRFVIP